MVLFEAADPPTTPPARRRRLSYDGTYAHPPAHDEASCRRPTRLPESDGHILKFNGTLKELLQVPGESNVIPTVSKPDFPKSTAFEEESSRPTKLDAGNPQVFENWVTSTYSKSGDDTEHQLSKSNYGGMPLNDATSQIRLLKLEGGGETPNWTMVSPVQLQFSPRKSSDAGRFLLDGVAVSFAAVSYEWGDATQTEPFNISGLSLQIRKNLARFLRAFSNQRRPGQDTSLPDYLWIDSICIDQENKEEKAHQIRLLNRVYRSATCVISWLGRATRTKAISYLASDQVCRDVEIADILKDVKAVLNNTYWTRIWMVQEIVLAQEWFIMCNEQILDGRRLAELLQRGFQYTKAFKIVEERALFEKYRASSLMNLLCRFLHLESTYPVDKIRALLALCSDDTDRLDRLLHPFADVTREFGLHPKRKKEICDEVVRLAQESDLDCKPWALVACRDLVAGVLGVNLPYLAAQLGTVFAERKTDWYRKTVSSASNPVLHERKRLEDKRRGKWKLQPTRLYER